MCTYSYSFTHLNAAWLIPMRKYVAINSHLILFVNYIVRDYYFYPFSYSFLLLALLSFKHNDCSYLCFVHVSKRMYVFIILILNYFISLHYCMPSSKVVKQFVRSLSLSPSNRKIHWNIEKSPKLINARTVTHHYDSIRNKTGLEIESTQK